MEGLGCFVARSARGALAAPVVRQASLFARCFGGVPWLSVSIAQPVTQEVAKLRDGNRDEWNPTAKVVGRAEEEEKLVSGSQAMKTLVPQWGPATCDGSFEGVAAVCWLGLAEAYGVSSPRGFVWMSKAESGTWHSHRHPHPKITRLQILLPSCPHAPKVHTYLGMQVGLNF